MTNQVTGVTPYPAKGGGLMRWHHDALSFIESYGVDPEVIEAAAWNPTTVTDDPRSTEVGYPIKRHRRGDVEVVVGYREPEDPTILYIRLRTPDEVVSGGSRGGGGGARQQPRTLRGLRQQIVSAGYRIERGGRHDLVRRPNGTVAMTLPITPSDARSIPNACATFRRVLDRDRWDEALTQLVEEVEHAPTRG